MNTITDETTTWLYRLGQYVRSDSGGDGPIIARSEQVLPGGRGEVRHSYRVDTRSGPQWFRQSTIKPHDDPAN